MTETSPLFRKVSSQRAFVHPTFVRRSEENYFMLFSAQKSHVKPLMLLSPCISETSL